MGGGDFGGAEEPDLGLACGVEVDVGGEEGVGWWWWRGGGVGEPGGDEIVGRAVVDGWRDGGGGGGEREEDLGGWRWFLEVELKTSDESDGVGEEGKEFVSQ